MIHKFVNKIMARSLRILQVIDQLASGGAERMVVELANQLKNQNINSAVCVTRSDMTLAKSINPEIQIFQLNRSSTWDLQGLKRFGKLIVEHGIDIIHAHGYSTARFVVAAKIYNWLHTPVIMHAHDSSAPPLTTQLLGRLGVSHFIGVAPQLTEWAQTKLRFSSNQVTLLGNAIDLAPYIQAMPIEVRPYFKSHPKWIGLVIANVRPVKDFFTLFRSLAQSQYKNEIGIMIAGSTANHEYLLSCQTLLRQLNLENQVVWLGSRNDLPILVSSVDFALLSSQHESGPIALLEYMAGGLPFIATKVGEVGEKVKSSGILAFVEPGDTVSFAHAIDQLLSLSPAQRAARGKQGQEFVNQHFSIDARILCLQKIYYSLI